MTANQINGLLVMLAALACSGAAYRLGKKGQFAKALAFIFLCGLILRVFAGMDQFLHPWDERFHAVVARNLISHPLMPTLYDVPALDHDYRGWLATHIWIHKPPMTLWLMAASLKLCGISEYAVRLPGVLLSSACILLTFFIAWRLFPPRVALLASFFFAINGFLIELATGRQPTDHVDTVFIFFIALGIFLSFHYYRNPSRLALLGIGFVTGCAVLTKWLPGLIILAVLFTILHQDRNWKRALIPCLSAFAISLVVFLPWQVYTHTVFPFEAAWEDSFNGIRHLLEPLDGHDGSVFFQVFMMPRIFGELIYLPVLWFIYALARKRLPKGTNALVVWLALPYIFFSLVATKMPGYVMISAPPVFMMLAFAIFDIREKAADWRYRKTMLVITMLLVLLPVRYMVERVRPFREESRNPEWARELRTLGSKTGEGRVAVFNIEHFIEAMFYAKVAAYPNIPTPAQIDLCVHRGFTVVIREGAGIPDELRKDTRVSIVR